MTEPNSDDSREQIAMWRSQLQAVELLRAVSAGDVQAAEQMYAHEAANSTLRELVSALACHAVSFARVIPTYDTTISEDSIYEGVATRARIGLETTVEIDHITRGDTDQ